MMVAGAIFILTLALVIWQPRGLGIGWSAAFGAGLALLSGVVHVGDIPVVWQIVWNATATFIAVIIISLLLDESGFFAGPPCTSRAGATAKADGCLPTCCCWGRGGGAVRERRRRVNPYADRDRHAVGARLPPCGGAGFRDGGGLYRRYRQPAAGGVQSGEYRFGGFFRLGFTEYAAVMVPVNVAAVAATPVMLHLFFRKDIPRCYALTRLPIPRDAIRDRATFRTGWAVLALLLMGFFAPEPLGVPVSLVAACGALVLLAVAKRGRAIDTGKVLRGAPGRS